MKWKSLSCVQLFLTSRTIESMEFSGQNTGVGSLSLLQGIFSTQGSNPSLLHCRWILYQLSHKGSPFSGQNGYQKSLLKNTGEGVEKREPSYTTDGKVNWCNHYGEQCRGTFKKLKIELPYGLAIPVLGIYAEKTEIQIQRYMHPIVHCSTIHDSQDTEANLNVRWQIMGKEDVIHVYNGILLSLEKGWHHLLQYGWTQRLSYHVKYARESQISYQSHVESKKMIQMNLFTNRLTDRKQTYSSQRGKQGEKDKSVWD